jgi:HEAT repeat protein/beta-lactamase regulating signal transducer with metallopeptidase domain
VTSPWIDLLLKVTLVLGVTTLGLHLTRSRTSAAQRHLISALALCACLLLPLLVRVAPAWSLPLLPRPEPVAADGAARGLIAPGVRAPRPAPAPAPALASDAAGRVPAEPVLSPVELLLLAWALGAASILFPFVRAAWRVSRLAHDPAAPEPAWAERAAQLAHAFGLHGVRFVSGPAGMMPMTWGLRPPVVLLPREADEWPDDRLRSVLTHELAHVSRRDCLTQGLARLACALYWFHPLVWQAARRLHADRERACDDLVLDLGARGADYADHLLQVARGLAVARHPDLMAVAMARPSELEGRLLAILDPQQQRSAPSRALAIGAVSVAAALLVPLAGLSPWRLESATVRAAGGDERLVAGHEETAAPEAAPPGAATPAPAAPAAVGQQPTANAEGDQDRDDDRVVAALRGALSDEDGQVRRQAAFALGQRRDARAAAPLVEALSDSVADVRQQAAFALGELRVAQAVSALAERLRRDEDADVRQQAAWALGEIGSAEAVPALNEAVADADGDVRQQAVFALGEIRDARAVPGLTRALEDPDADVRQQAAHALGELRAEAAVAPLIKVLAGDASSDVRQQAAFALGELRASAAVETLSRAVGSDADADVRAQAAFALGEIGDASAAEVLARALKDARPEVRKQAAFALSQLR